MKVGLIHLYYGLGEGKTCSAYGLATRCANHGYKVITTAFLKNNNSGEVLGKNKYDVVSAKTSFGFWWDLDDIQKQELSNEAKSRLIYAFEKCKREEYDMLVLDEVTDLIDVGAINENLLLDLIKEKPSGLEVVITGHKKIESIALISDYITEFVCEKHPYDKGVVFREGIEY